MFHISFQVNIAISTSPRIQIVALAVADADLPPTFGETVVTGYGSVVISVVLFSRQEVLLTRGR